MSPTREMNGRGRPLLLWERVLGLIEQDLAERRDGMLVVEVHGGSGRCEKEISELSASERRSLPRALGEHVAERVLDRHLAGQGYVDLADKRRAYTKKIEDLAPQDLPALIEADRQRAEEERERAAFAGEVRAAELDRLRVPRLAGMREAWR